MKDSTTAGLQDLFALIFVKEVHAQGRAGIGSPNKDQQPAHELPHSPGMLLGSHTTQNVDACPDNGPQTQKGEVCCCEALPQTSVCHSVQMIPHGARSKCALGKHRPDSTPLAVAGAPACHLIGNAVFASRHRLCSVLAAFTPALCNGGDQLQFVMELPINLWSGKQRASGDTRLTWADQFAPNHPDDNGIVETRCTKCCFNKMSERVEMLFCLGEMGHRPLQHMHCSARRSLCFCKWAVDTGSLGSAGLSGRLLSWQCASSRQSGARQELVKLRLLQMLPPPQIMPPAREFVFALRDLQWGKTGVGKRTRSREQA